VRVKLLKAFESPTKLDEDQFENAVKLLVFVEQQFDRAFERDVILHHVTFENAGKLEVVKAKRLLLTLLKALLKAYFSMRLLPPSLMFDAERASAMTFELYKLLSMIFTDVIDTALILEAVRFENVACDVDDMTPSGVMLRFPIVKNPDGLTWKPTLHSVLTLR
jgi:hypothetical protein